MEREPPASSSPPSTCCRRAATPSITSRSPRRPTSSPRRSPSATLGKQYLVDLFEIVGVVGGPTVTGSIAWVLEQLYLRAEKIDRWESKWRDTCASCQYLLRQAGDRFFHDAGSTWQLMLESPVETAVKPTLFAVSSNGGHAVLARVDAILARTEVEIQVDADLRLAHDADGAQPPTSGRASPVASRSGDSQTAPTSSGCGITDLASLRGGAASEVSVGPSASVVGSPPPKECSAASNGVNLRNST